MTDFDTTHTKEADLSAIAWINCDEGSGTAAADNSPQGNDLTLHGGVTWGAESDNGTPGENFSTGASLIFDGSSGYATNANLMSVWPKGGWTFSFRIYSASPPNNGFIFSKRGSAGLQFLWDNGGIVAQGYQATDSIQFGTPSGIHPGRWTQITLIYDPSIAVPYKMYQDDELVGYSTVSQPMVDDASGPACFGALIVGGGDPEIFAACQIDNIRFLPYAVSWAQFQAITNQREYVSTLTVPDKLIERGVVMTSTTGAVQEPGSPQYNSAWPADSRFRAVCRTGWSVNNQSSYTSADGFNWTEGVVLFGNGVGGESGNCQGGDVIRYKDGTYYKYYGTAGGVRYQSSTDMLTWTPQTADEYVVPNSAVSSFGGVVFGPSVFYDSDRDLVIMIATIAANTGTQYQSLLFTSTSPTSGFTLDPIGLLTTLQYGIGCWGGGGIFKLKSGLYGMFYDVTILNPGALPTIGVLAFSTDCRVWRLYEFGVIGQLDLMIPGDVGAAIQQRADYSKPLYVAETNTLYLYCDIDNNSTQKSAVALQTFQGTVDELVSSEDPILWAIFNQTLLASQKSNPIIRNIAVAQS